MGQPLPFPKLLVLKVRVCFEDIFFFLQKHYFKVNRRNDLLTDNLRNNPNAAFLKVSSICNVKCNSGYRPQTELHKVDKFYYGCKLIYINTIYLLPFALLPFEVNEKWMHKVYEKSAGCKATFEPIFHAFGNSLLLLFIIRNIPNFLPVFCSKIV